MTLIWTKNQKVSLVFWGEINPFLHMLTDISALAYCTRFGIKTKGRGWNRVVDLELMATEAIIIEEIIKIIWNQGQIERVVIIRLNTGQKMVIQELFKEV